jgi:pantetheine-phosphate adenylyltransferase
MSCLLISGFPNPESAATHEHNRNVLAYFVSEHRSLSRMFVSMTGERSLTNLSCIAEYYRLCFMLSPRLDVTFLLPGTPIDSCLASQNDCVTFSSVADAFSERAGIRVLAPSSTEFVPIDEDQERYCDAFTHGIVGGTFDHFHPGHKILLTTTAFSCTQCILLAVADGPLLSKKQYKDHIRPWQQRADNAADFLRLIRPNVEVVVHQLIDPFGPAIDRAEFQAIAITPETEKNALKINEIRVSRGMNALAFLYCVYVQDGHMDAKDFKLSSTTLRELEAKVKQEDYDPGL